MWLLATLSVLLIDKIRMINIKTQKEIEIMQEGGKILAKILKELAKTVKSGITTQDLDKLAGELVFEFGAKPAFLNYNGFPAALCTSLNDEIVHGVPSARKLQKGDLLKLDMGVLYKGFYTDSAVTVLVGERDSLVDKLYRGLPLGGRTLLKKKLIRVTRESLEIGIKEARMGKTLGDIGSAIQKYVEKNGFNVVRDLVGHGIGRELHEEPQVPNYGEPGTGPRIVEGMVIAIEPMVVTGNCKTKEGPDGFVFQTQDGGMAAHFEHTVAVTKKGPKIITVV